MKCELTVNDHNVLVKRSGNCPSCKSEMQRLPESPAPEVASELAQDFKELNVYFTALYYHGINQVKDAGHLWIEFTDKFNAFKKKVLAGYTAAKAATPDSREEGKGEMPTNIKSQFINAAKEFASVTQRGVTFNNPDKYKYFRAGQDNAYELLSPAPVTDKGVDVKFYLRKDDPVSDAVEFAEWKDSRYATMNINGTNMYYLLADERLNVVPTTTVSIRALYTIFLTQKEGGK